MPKTEFGTDPDLPKSGGMYVKLKAKGDKLKFRIAGTPYYHVDHWIEEKGKRKKIECAKYNSEGNAADCEYCDQHKEAVAAGNKELADSVRPVTTFMYPILNRDTGEAAIFQFTAKGIHYDINGYAKEGVDVFACDWLVERTEEPGSGYYNVKRLGEDKLSAEEQEELDRAKGFNLEGKASSSIKETEEDEEEPGNGDIDGNEDVPAEDMPF